MFFYFVLYVVFDMKLTVKLIYNVFPNELQNKTLAGKVYENSICIILQIKWRIEISSL